MDFRCMGHTKVHMAFMFGVSLFIRCWQFPSFGDFDDKLVPWCKKDGDVYSRLKSSTTYCCVTRRKKVKSLHLVQRNLECILQINSFAYGYCSLKCHLSHDNVALTYIRNTFLSKFLDIFK